MNMNRPDGFKLASHCAGLAQRGAIVRHHGPAKVGSHVFHHVLQVGNSSQVVYKYSRIVGFFLEASDGWATTSNEISERLMGSFQQPGDVVSSSISVRSVHQQSCFAGMDYSTTRRILKR